MACKCVRCPECAGSGTVWFAFPGLDRGGEYLGNHRWDDLDELEMCDYCGGYGVTETCYECQEAMNTDEEFSD